MTKSVASINPVAPSAARVKILPALARSDDYAKLSQNYPTIICPVVDWAAPACTGLARTLASQDSDLAGGLQALRGATSLRCGSVQLLGSERTLVAVQTEPKSLRCEERAKKLATMWRCAFETAMHSDERKVLAPLLGVRAAPLGCAAHQAVSTALHYAAAHGFDISFASNDPSAVQALVSALQRNQTSQARIIEAALSPASPTECLIQFAMDAYYAKPYADCPDMRPLNGINRAYHGVLHATRTSLVAEMLVALCGRHTQTPALSDEEAKLLRLAAAYHDSGNAAESDGRRGVHADNFRADMTSLRFDVDAVEMLASAIETKDCGAAWNGQAADKEGFFRTIVHDADCLEILRVRREAFDPNYLHLWNLRTPPTRFGSLRNNLAAVVQAHEENITAFGDYVGYQGLDWSPQGSRGGSKRHRDVEYSRNAYKTMREHLEAIVCERTQNKNPTLLELFGLQSDAAESLPQASAHEATRCRRGDALQSPDGSHYVTVGHDGSLAVCKNSRGGQTANTAPTVYRLAPNRDANTARGAILFWSPDGSHLAVGMDTSYFRGVNCSTEICLIDVTTGRLVARQSVDSLNLFGVTLSWLAGALHITTDEAHAEELPFY